MSKKQSKGTIKKRKADADDDYKPPDAVAPRNFPTVASSEGDYRLFDQHRDWIVEAFSKRTKTHGPTAIAKEFSTMLGLRENSIQARQLSNWYNYRVMTGQIPKSKKQAVSQKNSNLKAQNPDCMICLSFSFIFSFIREGRFSHHCQYRW